MSVQNAQFDSAPSVKPEDLSQPLYGASFGQAIKRYFKKYATFSGRASRSEYWWVMLLNTVITTVLYVWMMMSMVNDINPVTGELTGYAFMVPAGMMILYSLAVLVPGIALLVRRLHDGGFSAWFILLSFVPFVGGIAILVFSLLPSKPEGARYDAGAQQQQYLPYPQA